MRNMIILIILINIFSNTVLELTNELKYYIFKFVISVKLK